MKTDLFQPCGHWWDFQICWHIECSTLTASSFRLWSSSTGIPSTPLALFLVILSQGCLTSYSRMSGSRWLIIPSWLSRLLRPFLYSSVYYCHLFLMCLDLLVPNHFCPLSCPSLHEIFPLYFLEENSSLSHSTVFLYFFAFFTQVQFSSVAQSCPTLHSRRLS